MGSNGARCAILGALTEAKPPITPSSVSTVTGRSPNAISPLLRTLEDEGLSKRNPNSADRRSRHLTLTAAGKRMAQMFHGEDQLFIRSVLEGRSTRELALLEESLQSIRECVSSLENHRYWKVAG